MIQTDTLNMSKQKARLSQGPSSYNSFTYWGDVKKQWESAYSTIKITELIGSESMPKHNLPDVKKYLGGLSPQEEAFSAKFTEFYRNLAGLLTSMETPLLTEYDLAETLLDMRVLSNQVKFPCRILDIGPGAGRHMVNACLNPAVSGGLYVGIESIGLPYSLQNAAASLLRLRNDNLKFYDYMEYEFARKEPPNVADIAMNSVVHMPLWTDSSLPSQHFDLIICNYLLDEVSGEDFMRISDLISRCLAPGGILYCRGGQERAMLKDLYYYGYGTYHGLDITKTLTSKGLKVADSDLVASQMTRLFVRSGDAERPAPGGKYGRYNEDVRLMEQAQNDFVEVNMKELTGSGKKVLLWDDSGYQIFSKYMERYRENINIIGSTHRFARSKVKTGPGQYEYPPQDIRSLRPDVVIIASMRELSALRQIKEMSAPGEFELMRKFNYPVAFAYRTPPY
ncbi:MAG: class I SAM-dependent methyltransferase [Deltaproteobacteria bacterium]